MNTGPQDSAIGAALGWFQLTLVGSLASAIAIIAVGWFALMMLGGRLSRRRGMELIFGMFIVFGASTIASGIMSALSSKDEDPVPAPVAAVSQPMTPMAPVQQRPAQPYDPYAGAALPPRR